MSRNDPKVSKEGLANKSEHGSAIKELSKTLLSVSVIGVEILNQPKVSALKNEKTSLVFWAHLSFGEFRSVQATWKLKGIRRTKSLPDLHGAETLGNVRK